LTISKATTVAFNMTETEREAAESATPTGFSVTIVLPPKRIADLMVTLIESGDPVTRSWLGRVSASAEHRAVCTEKPWYSDSKFWAQSDFVLHVYCDKATSEDTGERFLKPADFAKGLSLLATVRDGVYANHLADIIGDNEDASTADIFMQMVVYGDEVYA
jgi:hypothetical protein